MNKFYDDDDVDAFEMFWTAYRTIETSREEMRTIPVRVYIQNEKVMQFPMTPYVKDTGKHSVMFNHCQNS